MKMIKVLRLIQNKVIKRKKRKKLRQKLPKLVPISLSYKIKFL